MTKDRLNDLPKTTLRPDVLYAILSQQDRNNELQFLANDENIRFTSIPVDHEHNVVEFLAQMDLIHLLVNKVQKLVREVEQIHGKMLAPMVNPKLGQELDHKTTAISKLSFDIATKLKKMEQVQKNQDDADKANAQWRIKESQITYINKQFRDVMMQYNQEAVLHRERCKKAMARQFESAGFSRSDDELEEMLQNNFAGTFESSLMPDIERRVKAANEIEAYQRDIVKLDKSVKELGDIFVDFALLRVDQGEMDDSIEHTLLKTQDYVEYAAGKMIHNIEPSVLKTQDNTEYAAVEVYEATESQEATIGKKCCIYIILIAIVVLALILGIYFLIQKKRIGR